MRLSRTDLDTFHRVVLDLHHPRGLSAFKQAAVRTVRKLIPARHFLFVTSQVDPSSRNARVVDLWESSPRLVPRLVTRMTREGLGHPFGTYTLQTLDSDSLRSTDFFSTLAFDSPEGGRGFHQLLGALQRIGATGVEGTMLASLTAIRRPEEPRFTRRDHQALELLLPHFVLGLRNARHGAKRDEREALSLEGFGLTAREIQVARQIALGRTNLEIGFALRIRARTVEKHVERILAKLGVENRTAAAIMITAWRTSE